MREYYLGNGFTGNAITVTCLNKGYGENGMTSTTNIVHISCCCCPMRITSTIHKKKKKQLQYFFSSVLISGYKAFDFEINIYLELFILILKVCNINNL